MIHVGPVGDYEGIGIVLEKTTSKIGEARFGKCRLTITPPEIFEGPREKNFQKKKKLAGEDPPDPLLMTSPASLTGAVR